MPINKKISNQIKKCQCPKTKYPAFYAGLLFVKVFSPKNAVRNIIVSDGVSLMKYIILEDFCKKPRPFLSHSGRPQIIFLFEIRPNAQSPALSKNQFYSLQFPNVCIAIFILFLTRFPLFYSFHN